MRGRRTSSNGGRRSVSTGSGLDPGARNSRGLDGESIYVGDRPEFHHWELQHSNNDYADLPGYLYQSNQTSLTSALPQEPLVDFALPYYRDAYDAIRDWIGLRRFYHFTDARIGYVWLFLPECRARLQEIKTSGGRVTIEIARGVEHITHELRLTGSWKTPNGPVAISLPVSRAASPTISEEIPNRATEVDLLLVDQTGAVLDYHQESQFWTLGKGRILPLSQKTRYEGLEVESEVMQETRPERVFIVHGHDVENRLRLERLLKERFGLEPVVLSHEPGAGRSLIEKLEDEIPKSAFAFVLMSPDDNVRVPGVDGTVVEYAQARPNVLFEMGWICGELGRRRMCILYRRGTNIHSDLAGVNRVEFTMNVEEALIGIERELDAAGLITPP